MFFGFGVILSILHLHAPWRTYPEKLPRQAVSRMEARAVVTEPVYAGEKLDWLRDNTMVEVKVNSMRRFPSEKWRKAGGKLVLRSKVPLSLEYGDVIQFRGNFIKPEPPVFKGMFDYRRYLLANGITHIAEIESTDIIRVKDVSGWRYIPYTIFNLREKGVEILSRRLKSQENRQIAAAMLFGYRDGLSHELKDRFVKSGAVHIFAISGLHVGIIAGILMLTFHVIHLDYRVRYWLLPVCLGIYVFMTGGAASATRAWIMISLWSFGKATFRPVSPINAVAFAALLLLILNPLRLVLPGFQFSFIIVSILLLGWRFTSQITRVSDEKYYWLPPSQHGMKLFISGRTRNASLNIALGISLAWLGSAGLVAWTNQLIIPQALLVNASIFIIAWGGLFTAVAKVITGALNIPLLEPLFGTLTNTIFSFLASIAELGAGESGENMIAFPGFFRVGIYYSLLFFALTPVCSRRLRMLTITAALLVLITFVINPAGIDRDHCEIIVFNGGKTDSLSLVIQPPGKTRPVLVNSGDYYTARRIASFLDSRGISHLRLVAFESGRYGVASGASLLCTTHSPEFILAPAGSTSSYFKAMQTQYQQEGGRVIHISRQPDDPASSRKLGNLEVNQQKTAQGIQTSVRLVDGERTWTVALQSSSSGRNKLVLKRNGIVVRQAEFINGLENSVEKFTF